MDAQFSELAKMAFALERIICAATGIALVAMPSLAGSGSGKPAILWDPAVIAANPLPDFSYAGYGFGLAEISDDPGTVINVTSHGVVPDDGKDDAKAVLRALAEADKINGRVTLRFPAGQIQIGEIIPIERSETILDGAGPDAGGTEFFFPRPLKIVDKSDRQNGLREYLRKEDKFERQPDQNIDFLFSEYSWSGGFIWIGPVSSQAVSYEPDKDEAQPLLSELLSGSRFGKTVTVRDSSKLSVGQVVQIHWFASEKGESPILQSIYGDIDAWNAAQTDERQKLSVGSHHWSFTNRPAVAQSTRIAAIEGDRVTLGDPLLHEISPRQPARMAEWRHLTNVGIQNIRFTFPISPWFGHHVEQGYNAIYMTGLFDGWARNLVIENADSGILTDNAASLTIENITTTGNHNAHYSVHIGAVHNVLVKNLRVENSVVHPLSVNTRSTRSVYQRATITRDSAIDQHSGSNHQNLFDQITMNVKPDQRGGRWEHRLWVGGGAGYWKPGHGLMNTHWNIQLIYPDDLSADARVHVVSGVEGPGARIVGVHANRQLEIDYRPTAYVEWTNHPVSSAPSLYDYQLARRRATAQKTWAKP